MSGQSRLALAIVYAGGLVFGIGLAVGEMTHMEVVLSFLRLEDLGLLLLMGSATVVTGASVALAPRLFGASPVGGTTYTRRLKSFDRQVLVGGIIFGIGWGLSGVCPGAAYASVGIGNYPVLWAVGGMFAGAYVQGIVRTWYAGRGR
jgi:uncharacterized membrane protein YedE/YeeE